MTEAPKPAAWRWRFLDETVWLLRKREPVQWPDTVKEALYTAEAMAAAVAAERERWARWHDDEAARWQAELAERRSWGGPTIGEDECNRAIEHHKASAASIRSINP
mgnify:CR=1 FL=1